MPTRTACYFSKLWIATIQTRDRYDQLNNLINS